MDDEEQQEQPTVRVDPEKFRQVLRAFYQVHNPARIADTPEAQSNFDTLISYYTSDVLALNQRLLPQYGAELQPSDFGMDRNWKPISDFSAGGPFSAGFGSGAARYRHPLEPPS